MSPGEKPQPETTAPAAASFETCLKRLEAIVTELERTDLPLEDSIRLFEEGLALSTDCRKQLDEAEGKIEMLVKREGKLAAEPFELKDSPER